MNFHVIRQIAEQSTNIVIGNLILGSVEWTKDS